MYVNVSSSKSQIATAQPLDAADLRGAETPQWEALRPPLPQGGTKLLARDGKLVDGEQVMPFVPVEALQREAARMATVTGQPVLRPATDSFGRPVILTYAPDGEVTLVSMLHFGDALRQAARQFGMGNLAARVCVALVENGSLRKASRSLGIAHMTAASEIADAIRATETHSQSGLVRRLAETWLGPADCDRVVELLMTTYGLRPRDAKVAALRAEGCSRPEAAARIGMSQWAMEASSAHVFATLGVAKAPELTRLVADLLFAADLAERYRSVAPAVITSSPPAAGSPA